MPHGYTKVQYAAIGRVGDRQRALYRAQADVQRAEEKLETTRLTIYRDEEEQAFELGLAYMALDTAKREALYITRELETADYEALRALLKKGGA